jgi:hypothetical protein
MLYQGIQAAASAGVHNVFGICLLILLNFSQCREISGGWNFS